MKQIFLLFLAAWAAAPLAAQAPKPPSVFEIRLVLPEAGPDTEDKVFVRHPGDQETLYLQRVPLIDQSAVDSAEVLKYPIGDAVQFVLQINFNERGRELLARVTQENVGKRVAFLIDGTVLMAPRVMSPIREGKAQIDSFDGKEMSGLAAKINRAVKRP